MFEDDVSSLGMFSVRLDGEDEAYSLRCAEARGIASDEIDFDDYENC